MSIGFLYPRPLDLGDQFGRKFWLSRFSKKNMRIYLIVPMAASDSHWKFVIFLPNFDDRTTSRMPNDLPASQDAVHMGSLDWRGLYRSLWTGSCFVMNKSSIFTGGGGGEGNFKVDRSDQRKFGKSWKIMKIMRNMIFQKLFKIVYRRFLHTPPISPCLKTFRLTRKHLENPIEIIYTSRGNPTLPSHHPDESTKNLENIENHEIFDFPKVVPNGS